MVGFCDVKHPTEELHRYTLRLPRSCWNSLVQWILHGFFPLSVHSMTSIKLCFSFLLLIQVDTEFYPNSSQVEYQLLSLSCVNYAQVAVQMYRKKSTAAFEQLKLKTLLVTHVSSSFKKKRMAFYKLLLPCKLILQNIHFLDCGCEILIPY